MAANPELVPEAHEIQRMEAVFGAQRRAFSVDPMPSADARRRQLAELKDAVIRFKDPLADAVKADFNGRSRHETFAELLASVQGIRYARRHVRRWMRPSRRRAGLLLATTSCRVYYQPKGVVGVMVP
ncbi:MAG: aldehyde dehydrogenase family protein, partial [Gammaproteobacteria bacterium]